MYADFASVYDVFMSETPYEEWSQLIDGWVKEYGIPRKEGEESNLLVDLGCGTGTLTELLAAMGYDCIGIDSSWEMLAVAEKKKNLSGKEILYLCQDMREMELYGTVGCVVSLCDSLNYLLTEEEIKETFCRVNNYLHPGGIFIFDFNTAYKYKEIIGETTIAENREECSFIWENFYHKREEINEYQVNFFIREEDGRYRRFQETHYQRGYSVKQMQSLLEEAGLAFIGAFDSETRGGVREDSGRIYMLARESGKPLVTKKNKESRQ